MVGGSERLSWSHFEFLSFNIFYTKVFLARRILRLLFCIVCLVGLVLCILCLFDPAHHVTPLGRVAENVINAESAILRAKAGQAASGVVSLLMLTYGLWKDLVVLLSHLHTKRCENENWARKQVASEILAQ